MILSQGAFCHSGPILSPEPRCKRRMRRKRCKRAKFHSCKTDSKPEIEGFLTGRPNKKDLLKVAPYLSEQPMGSGQKGFQMPQPWHQLNGTNKPNCLVSPQNFLIYMDAYGLSSSFIATKHHLHFHPWVVLCSPRSQVPSKSHRTQSHPNP